MSARQEAKRGEWECQLYLTAQGANAFVSGQMGVLSRSTDFHPHRERCGHIKPGFGGREIEFLNLNDKTAVI